MSTSCTRRCYRRVIRITAEDSPNVALALRQLAAGLPVTNTVVVPGVLPYPDYRKRREVWDPIRQAIGLDATFWEGADVLLYPPAWLDRAERIAAALDRTLPRRIAEAIGIDPAEGGDSTAMAVVDRYGLIELISKKTPDTSVIPREALALMLRYGVPPDRVIFDRGGGGKQAADTLRSQGYPVRTVAFGEALAPDPKHGRTQVRERLDQREDRYVYRNRRAEMYGCLRELLDPAREHDPDALAPGFGLPARYPELRRQLAPIPLTYDAEGRLELLPKKKRALAVESNQRTLEDLIGCSPDEADALVLAIFALLNRPTRARAGVAV